MRATPEDRNEGSALTNHLRAEKLLAEAEDGNPWFEPKDVAFLARLAMRARPLALALSDSEASLNYMRHRA